MDIKNTTKWKVQNDENKSRKAGKGENHTNVSRLTCQQSHTKMQDETISVSNKPHQACPQ